MLTSTHTMPPSGSHRENQRDHSFDDSELLTVKEVATLLRVPVSWVYDRTGKRSIDRLPLSASELLSHFLFLFSGPLGGTAAQRRASAFNWENAFRVPRHLTPILD